MNPLAQELNDVLAGTVVDRLLSDLGRRLYFPKGIISQTAEAKKLAHTVNATIGLAYNKGQPLVLSAIHDSLPTLNAAQAVAYAPTAGVDSVRTLWRDAMLKKNPSIKLENISLPAAVPGLTSGLFYIADLFLNEGARMLVSDPCWDNYGLIFADRRGAHVTSIPFFGDGAGLNLSAIEKSLQEAAAEGPVRLILNFPQNPSGYSPTVTEAERLFSIVRAIAEGGQDVLVICDDAYFGLNYEDTIYSQSLFGVFADMHERVLAVKIDGPTKEDYVWGFRLGFVTFGCRSLTPEAFDALEKKIMGAIRSSVSCSNSAAQFLLEKSTLDPRTSQEKAQFSAMLKERYDMVKAFITERKEHPKLHALPFNSGYFMSFVCRGGGAEKLRRILLEKEGIGTISFNDKYLRVAFSSVDSERINGMLSAIYAAASAMD